jgi:hypothetical protein
MPKPTRSLEEFLRRQHQDVPSLSGLDIDLELDAVRSRLRFEPNPHNVAWLHERADLLAEWRRRWFGEEPNMTSILSRNLHALEGCGCGKGSTAASPLPGASSPATTMITVRGRGRAR